MHNRTLHYWSPLCTIELHYWSPLCTIELSTIEVHYRSPSSTHLEENICYDWKLGRRCFWRHMRRSILFMVIFLNVVSCLWSYFSRSILFMVIFLNVVSCLWSYFLINAKSIKYLVFEIPSDYGAQLLFPRRSKNYPILAARKAYTHGYLESRNKE